MLNQKTLACIVETKNAATAKAIKPLPRAVEIEYVKASPDLLAALRKRDKLRRVKKNMARNSPSPTMPSSTVTSRYVLCGTWNPRSTPGGMYLRMYGGNCQSPTPKMG